MIKKVWAKFDGMDIACVCDEHHRKCQKDEECKEYVVKFTEIKRDEEQENLSEELEKETKRFQREVSKFQSELTKSLKKFKI